MEIHLHLAFEADNERFFFYWQMRRNVDLSSLLNLGTENKFLCPGRIPEIKQNSKTTACELP